MYTLLLILFFKYKNILKKKNWNIFIFVFQDLPAVIQRTADFLGKKLRCDELEKLAEHLSFKNMKMNGAINGEEIVKEVKARHGMDPSDPQLAFIRKGESGSWRIEMTPDVARQFDIWSTKKLKGTILEGTY